MAQWDNNKGLTVNTGDGGEKVVVAPHSRVEEKVGHTGAERAGSDGLISFEMEMVRRGSVTNNLDMGVMR